MFTLSERNIRAYDHMATQLRAFCQARGFLEVYTQGRLDILTACENPHSIALFDFADDRWPHRQTGQMVLEEALLKNPHFPGVFCFTTSYREERPQDMVLDRHAKIFPMFEFELHGGINALQEFEMDLLDFLGFSFEEEVIQYQSACNHLGVDEIDAEAEEALCQEMGPVVFLRNFPTRTSPFWNMRMDHDGTARKIDVLLHGMETIGSAERSCDTEEMWELFHTISGGAYASTLFKKFGRDRVEKELEAFLSLDFFTRSGGGIGLVPRLQRALELSDILASSAAIVEAA